MGENLDTLPSKTKAKVFISYSHKDEQYRERLESHLALLRRQGVIEAWHDRKIVAGDNWSHEIDRKLRDADIILMLISADFLASDYCYDVEVKQALAMHNAGDAVVIPIIVRPCDWMAAPFSNLQALPRDGKPISTYANEDEALVQTAQEIRRIAVSVEPSEGIDPTTFVEIKIDADFNSFSPEKEKALLDAIRMLLNEHDVKITSKRRGSTIVKLKLSRADLERLRLATQTGELPDMSILEAEIVTEDESQLPERPRVFVGSSTEGLVLAEIIQLNLDHLCEVTVWHQGVFTPGSGTLETLLSVANEFDFAVLLLTPDDFVTSRGDSSTSARDNVIFELGLFMGALGRDRTMIVYDRTSEMKIPSDLAGVTMITYQPHSSGDHEATLGAPCTRLKQQISRLGPRAPNNRVNRSGESGGM